MKRVALVAWTCTAVLVGLAGCSADGGADGDAGTSTADASTPPTGSASENPATGDGATTEPGSTLDLGEAATVAWQPAADVGGVLGLRVDAVRAGRMADFDGLAAAGSVEGRRPYYVDVTVDNAGETDLGGLDVPLYLQDTSDTLGPPWGFTEPFAPCRSRPLPESFAPGDSTRKCLVFFARAGATYDAVVFQPTPDHEPISWTGEAARASRGDRTGKGAGQRPSRRRQ